MEKVRPVIFKWRQFEPAMIVASVNWYLRYSLSLRDVEELLIERGVSADHTTVWRWVQRYAPELEKRLRPRLKPTNKSWRVDETYIRVKGKWTYLALSLRGGGFHRGDHRLSAVGTPGCRGGQEVLPEGFALSWASHPASDQRGQAPLLSARGSRTEEGRVPAPALSITPSAIFEQHLGAGPSSHQTTREGQPGFPIFLGSPANA